MITWFLQTLSTPKPPLNGAHDHASAAKPSQLVSLSPSNSLQDRGSEGNTSAVLSAIERDIHEGSDGHSHESNSGGDLTGSFHVNVREDEVSVNCSLLDEMHRMATNDLKVRKAKSSDKKHPEIETIGDIHDGDECEVDSGSECDSDYSSEPIAVCSRKPIAQKFSSDVSQHGSHAEFHSDWRIVDSATRLSLCKIWSMQKDYFTQEAEKAVQRLDKKNGSPGALDGCSVIDTLASSNASLACEYARLVASYIRDILTSDSYADSQQPFYILELGSGTGRFAWMFLNHFSEFAQTYGLFSLIKKKRNVSNNNQSLNSFGLSSIICYILSDMCLSHIEMYRQNPQLADFVEQGVLDFALVDAEDFSTVHLLERNIHIVPYKVSKVSSTSGKSLTDASDVDKSALSPDFADDGLAMAGRRVIMERPLIAICNYLFSSLPQDAFRVTPQGGLEEVRPTIWSASQQNEVERLSSEIGKLSDSWISWDALPLSSYARLAKQQRKEQISRLRKMQKEHEMSIEGGNNSIESGDSSPFPTMPLSPLSAAFMYYSGNISLINDTLDDIVSSAAIMYDLSSRKLAPQALDNPFLAAKIATKFSKPRLSLIPTGALKCIECLRRLAPKIQLTSGGEGYSGPKTSPSLMVLVGDKCTRNAYTSLTSGRSTSLPMSYHGSISLPVNTALLKLYTELRGGKFLCPTTLGGGEDEDVSDIGSALSSMSKISPLPSFSTCSIVFGSTWKDEALSAFSSHSDATKSFSSPDNCSSPTHLRSSNDSLLRTPQQAPSTTIDSSSPLDDAKMLILTPAQRRASLVHKEMLRSTSLVSPTSPKPSEVAIPSESQSVSISLSSSELSLWTSVRGLRSKMRKRNSNLPSLQMNSSTNGMSTKSLNGCLVLSREDTLSSFREAFANYECIRERSLPKLHSLLTTSKDLLLRCAKGVVASHELNDVLNFVIDHLRDVRCEPSAYGALLPGLIALISSYDSKHIGEMTRDRLISIAADSLRLYYPYVSAESALDIDFLFETGRLALTIDALDLAEECFFASLEESGNAAGCHWNLALCKLRRHSQTNLPLLEKDREWLRERFEMVLRSDPTTILREDTLRALTRLASSSGITMR